MTNTNRFKLGEELSELWGDTSAADHADLLAVYDRGYADALATTHTGWKRIPFDEIRKGMRIRVAFGDTTREGVAHRKVGHTLGWQTPEGSFLTSSGADLIETPDPDALPREVTYEEALSAPIGSLVEVCYRVVVSCSPEDGRSYLTPRGGDTRYYLTALPADPDQPVLDALVASGLTPEQARAALDAIELTHNVEPKPVES